MNPSALVPECVGNCWGKEKCKATEKCVMRQAVIGVAEVPDIVRDNEDPGHIGPKHIMFIFGGIDTPPSGHAEDVQESGDAVKHIVPAGNLSGAFGGNPSLLAKCKEVIRAFKVRDDGNQNIDCNDDKRKGLEPVSFAELSPVIFNDHKPETSGKCCVYLGIMEPAVLIYVGWIIDGPFLSVCYANRNCNAIDGHGER